MFHNLLSISYFRSNEFVKYLNNNSYFQYFVQINKRYVWRMANYYSFYDHTWINWEYIIDSDEVKWEPFNSFRTRKEMNNCCGYELRSLCQRELKTYPRGLPLHSWLEGVASSCPMSLKWWYLFCNCLFYFCLHMTWLKIKS